MEPRREWFEKNYYAILGVPESATDKDITKAYRKLARELHPDKNPGDAAAEERFKEVSSAYEVLEDTEARAKYDEVRRLGPMGAMGGAGGPGGPGGFSFDFGGASDLGDLLGSMFGGGGGGGFAGARTRPMRGRDQEAQITLDFEEAVRGVTMPVTVGSATGPRQITVRIPAGVDDGQRIRLRGQGGAGMNGGPAGDLFVIVRVEPHEVFGREGHHMTLTVPVTFAEAALGADIKVPTFDGEPVRLRLPAGTQSGRTFRVKGRGVVTSKSTGDLLVTVEVVVPTKLSTAERKALEAFSAEHRDSPRAYLGI